MWLNPLNTKHETMTLAQSMHTIDALLTQMQTALDHLLSTETETNSTETSSTVWVGSHNAAHMPDIKIHETDRTVTLFVYLPNLPLRDLEVYISSETAIIQGKSTQDEVEGYFSAEPFQHIIPLPILVHPEAVQASFDSSVLTLSLPKSGRIQRQRIAVKLDNDRTSDPAVLSPIGRGL